MGSDTQCMFFGYDMRNCGDESQCVCAKYRFTCENDLGCTEQENQEKATKWAYATVGSEVCEQMRQMSLFYKDVSCCNEDKCNQPQIGTTCLEYPKTMFNTQ